MEFKRNLINVIFGSRQKYCDLVCDYITNPTETYIIIAQEYNNLLNGNIAFDGQLNHNQNFDCYRNIITLMGCHNGNHLKHINTGERQEIEFYERVCPGSWNLNVYLLLKYFHENFDRLENSVTNDEYLLNISENFGSIVEYEYKLTDFYTDRLFLGSLFVRASIDNNNDINTYISPVKYGEGFIQNLMNIFSYYKSNNFADKRKIEQILKGILHNDILRITENHDEILFDHGWDNTLYRKIKNICNDDVFKIRNYILELYKQ